MTGYSPTLWYHGSRYRDLKYAVASLDPASQRHAQALAVFHCGAHMHVLDHVLEIDADDYETVPRLVYQLTQAGLVVVGAHSHLRMVPELSQYLNGLLDAHDHERLTRRWASGMCDLIGFMYGQRVVNSAMALQMAQLEIANILALLEWLPGHLEPLDVASTAARIELLFIALDRPQAHARASAVLDMALARLNGIHSDHPHAPADRFAVA